MIPLVVAVTCISLAFKRHWRLAAFFLTAILVEVTAYRAIVALVPRERPNVDRLENLPLLHSFPSGHVAASVAVYGSLALVLGWVLRASRWRYVVYGLGVALPLFVAASRMYRGMHNPTDALAGLIMGCLAVALALFVARVVGVVVENRKQRMTKVAVVAHSGKTVGGGLGELRAELAAHGVDKPLWFEVPKSKKAPKRVRQALDEGAELIFAWGGDGTVQRCLDVMAGKDATLAVVPAGTANLFASNLGIPADIAEAVEIGLHGRRRTIDVGNMRGERFGVMAGAGLDARMIRDADGTLKDRLGRLAYVWTGVKNARASTFRAKIAVDGTQWYEGEASLVLAGNLGEVFAGVEAFEDAAPDDGELELGVVRADGLVEWARTAARAAVGKPSDSPFVQQTRGRSIEVKLDRKVPYELDGGDRDPVKRFDIEVEPASDLRPGSREEKAA